MIYAVADILLEQKYKKAREASTTRAFFAKMSKRGGKRLESVDQRHKYGVDDTKRIFCCGQGRASFFAVLATQQNKNFVALGELTAKENHPEVKNGFRWAQATLIANFRAWHAQLWPCVSQLTICSKTDHFIVSF